jgi:hypothetical protein
MLGIGERARRHGLVAGKNGKLIPKPREEEAAKSHPYPPKESIPGLMEALDDVQDLDDEVDGSPNGELQPLVDYLERSLDDGPDELLDEFDIEDL